ncbi:hypothetical protein ABPG75_006176 [Micractinium tetrahymenae]
MLALAQGWLAPALHTGAGAALRLAAPALWRHLSARPHAHAHLRHPHHPIPHPNIQPRSEDPQSRDHVPHQLSCIVPEQPSQPPLPCLGLKYAPRVWSQVAELFPDRHASPPACIAITPDLSETSGLCPAITTPGRELQAAGFRVTSLLLRRPMPAAHGQQCGGVPAPRPCCLQVASDQAAAEAAAAGTGQAAAGKLSGADLFCFADTMHMVDVRRALQAAHRHLRPHGLLLVLWTDLDLSDGFVLGLEELLEGAMPGYCRYDCQRDPAIWAPRLQLGGLFRLIDYSALPHSLSLPASTLLDSLDSRAALRSALATSGRRGFHARLQRLVDAHFGPQATAEASTAAEAAGRQGSGAEEGGEHSTGSSSSRSSSDSHGQVPPHSPAQQKIVELSLHTKAYLLARAAAVVPPALRGGQAARGLLEPERYCIFCGNPVAPG